MYDMSTSGFVYEIANCKNRIQTLETQLSHIDDIVREALVGRRRVEDELSYFKMELDALMKG